MSEEWSIVFRSHKKTFLFCLSHLDCIAGPGAKKKSKSVKETKKKGKPKKSKSKAGQGGKRKKGSSVSAFSLSENLQGLNLYHMEIFPRVFLPFLIVSTSQNN